ncbi:hypothetical protein DFH07DRAFT_783897 [Mycena maculata]|uniref:Uncharacterized protein n=1 Tax=Mycena maculata TaxID=230809 RepID=A0AAD7ML65_9AGAR|nr:hypothetical protein DFH07DRAFT_783897 [Mycena maculata]
MECNDGTEVYNSQDGVLPVLMLRTFRKSRKFCQQINDADLTEKQIGTIRMPAYMDPDCQDHQNLALESIFEQFVPDVAQILAVFGPKHPVVCNFNGYSRGKTALERSRKCALWLQTLDLVPTPELEEVLQRALHNLLVHTALVDLTKAERNERVMGVGAALLQLLAVQNDLGEPLNLNSTILDDILDCKVTQRRDDSMHALAAMFSDRHPQLRQIQATRQEAAGI